jgi:AmpE protein
MKLFVLVICMLLERYGEHFDRIRRFDWFRSWTRFLVTWLPTQSSLFLMGCIFLPILLGLKFLFLIVGILTGSWGVSVVQGFIFFFCLGPQNLFQTPLVEADFDPEMYFEKLNRQWFGVIFWYLLLGVWGAVIYRLLDLIRAEGRMELLAHHLLQYLDWIPVRLTSLLYLLIGNFQQAYPFFIRESGTGVAKNQVLLTGCGVLAAQQENEQEVSYTQALQLVWHATILLLVVLAFKTLATL